jgi:flagellar hook assembly protein FlgD
MARPHPHKRAAHLAAISILSLLGAIVAVWAAPRASEAVAAWMSTPPVQLRTTSLPASLPVSTAPGSGGAPRSASQASGAAAVAAGTASPVIDAGMRFTMVGVICAPPARGGEVQALIRTSEDGATWSRWYVVALERAAEEGGREQAFTEPIWTGGGRYLQVAARGAGDAEPAPGLLRKVRVVAINSTEDADAGATVLGVLRRAAATVAGLELAPPVGAMTTKPTIVTRSQWGADESWRSGTPDVAPVKMAFVHHTDSGNDYSAAEAPAIVRAVYGYHTRSLHWSDVGYNFLVDRFGVIYEGRYGGVTRGVIGAQTLGFNTGSTGVSVIGTFTSANPPSAAVTSLERLLEWKLDVHHVDPLGTGTLTCGYGQKFKTGQRVTFPAIAGHRDANYTDCPGGRLYAQMPNVRKVVARTGQPKIYGFIAEELAISPNGDGVSDSATIGFTVSQPASWRLEIRDEAGQVVRNLAGEGTVVEASWTGAGDDGRALPDGIYTLRVDATSPDGVARPATSELRLDTEAPLVSGADVSPTSFSPNDDGWADTATLAFLPDEDGSARVSVIGADDKVLRRVSNWETVTAETQSVAWDGRVGSGSSLKPVAEGAATLLLEVRDLAGNATSLRRSVTVDRTLGLSAASRTVFSPDGNGVRDTVTVAFTLTRAADVTVTVARAGTAARTMRLGKLAAGAGSATWDGGLGGGAAPASGVYSIDVTADGSMGVSTASRPVTVDLAPPKLTVPATATVRRGRTARLAFTVRDAFSPKVKVGAVVTNAKGKTLATIACGWVKQGAKHTCSWKPRTRGTYTVTFRAVDLGGNQQVAAVKTSLRVR